MYDIKRDTNCVGSGRCIYWQRYAAPLHGNAAKEMELTGMSTQSQNPSTGQQDQKQRNPGSTQDPDKHAREDNDQPGAKKEKEQQHQRLGGQSADDEGHGDRSRR